MDTTPETIDCACVIHGDSYDWIYVERLYNMLKRNLTPNVKFHVYTEEHRAVPQPWIKHELTDFGIGGPRQGWWYKMQLFNSEHHAGPLLYFDLDTVIVKNIDWIWNLPSKYMWAVRDFKYLWRPLHQGLNSSIMWWDTRQFHHVWSKFCQQGLSTIMREHRGDQDYIGKEIDNSRLRFLDQDRIQSWRWQCLDGGYDFRRRMYLRPNSGTTLLADTDVLVFHGKPKPNEIADPVILKHWQ